MSQESLESEFQKLQEQQQLILDQIDRAIAAYKQGRMIMWQNPFIWKPLWKRLML